MEHTINSIIGIILLLIGALSVGICKDATFFLVTVVIAIIAMLPVKEDEYV